MIELDKIYNINLTGRNIRTIRNLIIDWEQQEFVNVNPEASNYGVDALKDIFDVYD